MLASTTPAAAIIDSVALTTLGQSVIFWITSSLPFSVSPPRRGRGKWRGRFRGVEVGASAAHPLWITLHHAAGFLRRLNQGLRISENFFWPPQVATAIDRIWCRRDPGSAVLVDSAFWNWDADLFADQ